MTTENTPTSLFCEVPDANIHFHQLGQGEPLLMIHGGAPGAFGWGNFKANCEALKEKFCLIVVDLPDYGKSQALGEKASTILGCAEIFNEFMQKLGHSRYHVLGMATGGSIAAEMAIHFSEHIKKLILISAPVGYSKYQDKNKSPASKSLAEEKNPSIEHMRSYLLKMLHNKELLTEDIVLERFNENRKSKNMKDGKKQKNNDLWKYIDKIENETLIVWGRENHAHSYENAIFMHSQIKNSQLHIFGNCGLWVPFEKQESFDKLVIDFL